MKISHNYDHSHAHSNQNLKPIFITFILNLSFAIIEFIGFILSGSMILYSSSIHDIGDSITLLATLFIEKKSNSGRDNTYTYGYRRYTLVGSTINYSILIFGGISAIIASTINLLNPHHFDPHILLYTSLIGIVINVIGFQLVNSGEGLTNRSLAANLFADIANFIAIAISSLLILWLDIYILDSIFSIIFSIIIIYHSLKSFRHIFKIIMQATPEEIDYEHIKKHIMLNKSVVDIHDIHIWDLDSEDYIFTAHLVVADGLDDNQLMVIKESIRNDLEVYKINHSTIEIDNITNAIKNGEYDPNQ